MNLDKILNKLGEEIKGKQRKELIAVFEETLSENVEELLKSEDFFNLPLNNIFSVISNVDFNEIEEENDKVLEIIQNIIKNIIKAHSEEKETILILQNLNLATFSFFSYEEIFSVLELITNCPILVNFCNLCKQKQISLKYYEIELQRMEKEIKKLTIGDDSNLPDEHKEEEESKIEKPTDYESDIFKACKEGKLTSVQWLFEKENEDKNKKADVNNYELGVFKGDTPIHIAVKNAYLPIVKYLIEKQDVDKDIKGSF